MYCTVNRQRHAYRAVALAIGLFAVFTAQAVLAATQPPPPAAMTQALDEAQARLREPGINADRLKKLLTVTEGVFDAANDCAKKAAAGAETVEKQLKQLGTPEPKETGGVTTQRKLLSQDKERWLEQEARCRRLVLRADELRQQIGQRQQEVVARSLMARGRWIGQILVQEGHQLPVWLALTRETVGRRLGLEALATALLPAMLLSVIAGSVLIAIWGRRLLAAWQARRVWADEFGGQLSRALAATVAFYLPYLLPTLAAAIFTALALEGDERLVVVRAAAFGLPVYFASLVAIHTFLYPRFIRAPLLNIPRDMGAVLARVLKVISGILFVGYLLTVAVHAEDVPYSSVLVVRAAFAVVLLVSIARVVMLLRRVTTLRAWHLPVYLLFLVVLVAVGAELIGYRNLAVYIARGFFDTLLLFFVLTLLHALMHEVFYGLQHGWRSWHQRVRGWFGLQPGERTALLPWLYSLAVVAIWTVAGFVLLNIWNVPDAIVVELQRYLTNGFQVGSVNVVPVRIFYAVAAFALLYAFSSWLRGRMDRYWQKRVDIDRGAREAAVSILGYSGVIISIIVGLSVAGVGFGNLALIAGALSVGIGFGLQNIVNNFVSGLILLFERPIKTGDWVSVGSTEGYVKSIRMRSTQIQTFDRADVIVPNSELVSSQVTNWMLHDPRGRVRVPVGVAYGSDTEKVRQILLDVVAAHPEVITDSSMPAPRVLFREFGESSLNFELRAFIRNIDHRLVVTSDLNFAIDAAFRKNGVEIPFPQRDIHIRDGKGLGGSAPGKDAT